VVNNTVEEPIGFILRAEILEDGSGRILRNIDKIDKHLKDYTAP
jgi:hypothetical protein